MEYRKKKIEEAVQKRIIEHRAHHHDSPTFLSSHLPVGKDGDGDGNGTGTGTNGYDNRSANDHDHPHPSCTFFDPRPVVSIEPSAPPAAIRSSFRSSHLLNIP